MEQVASTGGRAGGWLVRAALLLASLCGVARADVLLDETRTVAAAAPAVERVLNVASAGELEVAAVDLAVGAPLAALRVVVTRGDAIVGTPLTAAGTFTLQAEAGVDYVVRVLGRPSATTAVGAAGITITRTVDPQPRTPVLEFVATFQLPVANPLSVLVETELTFPAAGTYTATLVEAAFPAALDRLEGYLFYGSEPVAQFTPGMPVTFTAPAASAPGPTQYKLVLAADAEAAARAGLFGLRIAGGPANATVYDVATPVGELAAGRAFANPAAGQLTLELTDPAFPAALGRVGALLTSGGVPLGSLTAPGSTTVTAPAANLVLWTHAVAGSSAGTLAAVVRDAAAHVLASEARAASATGASAPVAQLYAFEVATAGTYRVRVTDFQFPSALPALQFIALQNGATLGQATSGGSIDVNAVAGSATLLVLAQVPAGGSGLFGAEVLGTGATAATLLDETHGVGALSDSRPVIALADGRYDVTLQDIAWPARFQDLALAITRGGQLVGRIYGGGTFAFDATRGRYLATLVATPNAAEAAGLYSLRVQSSPPTVTLAVDNATIQSGQGVRLTWSSTGATACTATGTAWSGTKQPNGTESVGPLSANASFTLTCTGPGGSAAKTTGVTVTPAPSSGGGGGAAGLPMLLSLLALAGARLRRVRAVR